MNFKILGKWHSCLMDLYCLKEYFTTIVVGMQNVQWLQQFCVCVCSKITHKKFICDDEKIFC